MELTEEEDEKRTEVGILYGIHTLGAMNVYEDATGLFITKTHLGMCGTEHINIYFKNNQIIEIEGHTYTFIRSPPPQKKINLFWSQKTRFGI